MRPVILILVIAFSTFAMPNLANAQATLVQYQPTVVELDRLYDNRPKFDSEIESLMKSRVDVGDDFEVLYRLSRLAYYTGFFILADSTDKNYKIELFQYGTKLAEKAKSLNTKRVEGFYWFAVNQGGYGLTKGVFASLGGARAMLEALDEAVKIDSKYYFGGPLRVRGRLYFKLPGGFISFGDNQKALVDLQKAVEIAPENRLNHMYLADILAKVKTKDEAKKRIEIAKSLPDSAGEKEEIVFKKELAELEKRVK